MQSDEAWWELDGGPCDNHRICFDGEWWGAENVTPRDLKSLYTALERGDQTWHHYTVTRLA